MIKLGSENFAVTDLKSTNYLNLISYCVSRKLMSKVLEIQGISCKKMDKFLPF